MHKEEFNYTISDALRISPVAQEKLLQLVESEPDINGIRIYVSGGGCSGMTYGMTFIDTPTEFDCAWERNGLKVYVDAVALNLLESLVIANAVGLPLPDVRINGAAGVLMIPIPKSGMLRQFNGVDASQAVRYVDEVRITAPVGHELVALPEGSSYLGFIFSRAETPEQAEAALREAHRKLRFKIDPVWHIS